MMPPRYPIHELERRGALVPDASGTPPPFPADDGDPLTPNYELARQLLIAAANGHENPDDFPAGASLMQAKPKSDAYLAVMRWCAWAHIVKNRPEPGAWTGWRRGLYCFRPLASRLATAGRALTDDHIEELKTYTPIRDGHWNTFPCRALDDGLINAMRRKAKEQGGAPRAAFEALVVESKLPAPDGDHAQLTDARLRVFALDEAGLRELLLLARARTTEIWNQVHRWNATINGQMFDYREVTQLLQLVEDQLSNSRGWQATDIESWISWTSTELTRLRRPRLVLGILHCMEDAEAAAVTPTIRAWIQQLIHDETGRRPPNKGLLERATAMLDHAHPLVLQPGEAWSDRALADLAPSPDKDAWMTLLSHAQTASASAPSTKWLKATAEFLNSVGREPFTASLLTWLPLVDKPRTAERERRPYEPDYAHLLLDPHMDLLKGLCWIAGTIKDPNLARALGRLAISCYRKVPGIGPRATKVGNAAVYALGQMPGMDSLGQLAMLRVKVKFGTAQKGIEKALNAAAARENLPRDEIEELGVPTYGLTDVGTRTETLGDFEAELTASGIGDTSLVFYKVAEAKRAKPIKSVPAALKASHAEDLKDLKSAMKDIAAMLPAQKDRIDAMFLEGKSWPLATWKDRYLNHPLIGILARRLIWIAAGPTTAAVAPSFTFLNDSLVDSSGTPVPPSTLPTSATIRLWHPLDSSQDEVLAWRRFFEDRQVKQPFKQAHREVYLLTDAERRTSTYSNRFAAHVIKQHQFHALCAARGWKNKLRLMVDDEYPPSTRPLVAHNLRAEFWVEGVGDEYGTHTNDAGVYNHLTTDQVRFYQIDSMQASAHASGGGYGMGWRNRELEHGLPLEAIPPLILSEVLRDCDLFVGVCSVANNPEWNDGGPGGAHRNYWWTTSFGDLSQTGSGRKDLLLRLLPKLKLAAVASLKDNFLFIRGKLRTYKIHLGSGNILMEPNDQYLCIVPGGRSASTDVFLPFEGDRTLAVILSKAFMLAEDDKIQDPTITRQITGK